MVTSFKRHRICRWSAQRVNWLGKRGEGSCRKDGPQLEFLRIWANKMSVKVNGWSFALAIIFPQVRPVSS